MVQGSTFCFAPWADGRLNALISVTHLYVELRFLFSIRLRLVRDFVIRHAHDSEFRLWVKVAKQALFSEAL